MDSEKAQNRRTEVRNAAAKLSFEILEEKGFKREVSFKAIAKKLNLTVGRVKSYIYGDKASKSLADEVKMPQKPDAK